MANTRQNTAKQVKWCVLNVNLIILNLTNLAKQKNHRNLSEIWKSLYSCICAWNWKNLEIFGWRIILTLSKILSHPQLLKIAFDYGMDNFWKRCDCLNLYILFSIEYRRFKKKIILFKYFAYLIPDQIKLQKYTDLNAQVEQLNPGILPAPLEENKIEFSSV